MRGKHRQARLTEGIPNAKLITITFNNIPDKNRWTQFRSNFIWENCVDISRWKRPAGRWIINLEILWTRACSLLDFRWFSFELIANTSSAQAASWTFTKPCLLRILNQINYLKHSFIFMSTVVILYILRFLSLTGCRFAWPSEEEKHASTTLISSCPIKKFTDL